MDVDAPTCARTDAIPVNRDVQVKYDVAKNEGGPLRRTVKSELADAGVSQLSAEKKGKASTSLLGQGHEPTLQRHPGLSERFTNLEDHLVLKYGLVLKDISSIQVLILHYSSSRASRVSHGSDKIP